MKKRIFCVLLALCLFASLLPMTALAADPDITVNFFNKGTNTERDNKTPGVYISLTIKPGDPAKYITANAEGYMTEHTGATAPADNFVKLEYPADGAATLKVTLNNISIDSLCANDAYHAPSIEFGAGAYSVNMELIGTNKIVDGRSACIKNNNDGGLTITGTENSSLTLQMGSSSISGAAAAALWANGGNLVIKNANLNFEIYTNSSSQHNSILSAKGTVLLDNVIIKNKTNNTGKLVFTGLATANDPRYTIDPDATRTVTIKNCNIESATGGTMFRTVAPVVINNSTIKATGAAPLFEGKEKDAANNPTIEGEFSGAYATKANATKQNKWKALTADNMSKLKSCGFVYIVPGKVDLVPTEATTEPEPTTKPTTAPTTEATEAPTTEATEAPTTEATEPVDGTKPTTGDTNDATKPTTGDKNEATKPATDDKDNNKGDNKGDNKTDGADEKKSGSPLKVILIILIVLVVLGGGAVGVIFYLRSKNTAEEGEEAEDAEEAEEAEESEEETQE